MVIEDIHLLEFFFLLHYYVLDLDKYLLRFLLCYKYASLSRFKMLRSVCRAPWYLPDEKEC